MRFRVLGPLAIEHEGSTPSALSAPMLRRLLAALLSRANEPVSIADLNHALWGDNAPFGSRKTLQVYVRRLRTALGDESRILHEPAGYRVVVYPGELDAAEFARLVKNADTVSGASASALLAEALDLWRGPAYEDVREHAPIADEAGRLDEERLRIEVWHAQVELELGRHTELVPRLTKLTEAHPYREDLRGHLMLALYRSGRQAEGLDAYRRTRRQLIDELGIEPSESLRRLHQQILASDPALDLPRPSTRSFRFLPSDIPDFIGRADDLERLDEIAAGKAQTAVITAIAGTAGIGKTALAIHWGHRVAERFIDGQLYVNLRGYDQSPPLRPIEALSYQLRCLGLPPEQVPTDVDTAAAKYRTLLAGKRMLIVLDNANSPEQVRPLLPGEAGCLVVVTSRDRLSGLIARDGAVRHALGLLSPAESLELLSRLIGYERVQTELEAATQLVGSCAHLPLALRIAAAHLADRQSLSIVEYLEELHKEGLVSTLTVEGDEQWAVQAVLDQSYRSLDTETQCKFRLLGRIPGPDFTTESVAALTGAAAVDAATTLDNLIAAHLIGEHRPGRYSFHDLIRDYAHTKHEDDAASALKRLFDYYQETADVANSLIRAEPVAHQSSLGTSAEAMAWLTTELANIVAAISTAAAAGSPATAIGLARPLSRFFLVSGDTAGWIGAFESALSSADHATLDEARLFVLNSLGIAYAFAGRFAEADHALLECIAKREALGDRAGAARSRNNLAVSYDAQGRWDESLVVLQEGLEIAERLADKQTEALIRSANLLKALLIKGELEQARENVDRAVTILREIGSPHDLGRALVNAAEVYQRIGQSDAATEWLREAMRCAAQTGDQFLECVIVANMGDLHCGRGAYNEAIECRKEVVERYRRMGYKNHLCESLNKLANVYAAASQPESAVAAHQDALGLARQLGVRGEQAHALAGIGRLTGDKDMLHAALAIFEEISPADADAVRQLV